MDRRVGELRRVYDGTPLVEGDLEPTWLGQFGRWMQEAVDARMPEPNAMVLSTSTPDGVPSSRTVLLQDVTEAGFRFFTNLGSRKSRELLVNPACALVFPWLDQHRQVVITGRAGRLPDPESDAYFATRPRGSQLGAWASRQSTVIEGRPSLDEAYAAAAARFPDAVPRPSWWGGWVVVPATVEFWQGRPDRLHDRLRFERDGDAWVVHRLAP